MRFKTKAKRVLGQIWRSARKPSPVHIGIGVFVIAAGITLGRTHFPLEMRVASSDAVPLNGPLTVRFSQDIASSYRADIEPAIPGSWETKRSPLGVYEASFMPSQPLQAAQSYKIRITNIKRAITGLSVPDIEAEFTAELADGIKSIYPAYNSKDVPVSARMKVTRSDGFDPKRKLKAKLVPELALRQVSDGQTLEWQSEKPFKQGGKYTLLIEDESLPEDEQLIISSTFHTVTEPKVVKATKGGHFSPGKKLQVQFDQPMADESTFIKFDLAGTGKWVTDKIYRYTPSDLKPGKNYSYVLMRGLKSKAGGVLEKDQKIKFSTNGAVKAGFSPGGSVGLNTPVRVTFDQPVKKDSAQAHFRVVPALKGSYSWSGNTMTFSPRGAAYQTTYTFQMTAGVEPEWGLPSKGTQSSAYTTIAQTKRLNVPLIAQQAGRTCEVASLRMALAYRGVNTSESSILGRLGYNPRPRGSTWDNPNQMFVGYANTFDWSRGYGVHAGPLASAGNSYGRSSSAYFGVSAQFIASQIHAGHPVIVYGHISPPRADSWNTPSSGRVNTTTSMHARVVYGVYGSKSNPISFYVHDPWSGGSSGVWSVGGLMANMNAVPGVSNQAVVVR